MQSRQATSAASRSDDEHAERQCACGRSDTPKQRLCRACYRAKKEARREGRERHARRVDALYRRLQRSRPQTIDAAYALRAPGGALEGWRRRAVDEGVDALVSEGVLEEGPHGELIIRRRHRTLEATRRQA